MLGDGSNGRQIRVTAVDLDFLTTDIDELDVEVNTSGV